MNDIITEKSDFSLLKLVEKTNPILREVIPDIKDFKNKDLQIIINNMLHSILPEQLKKANAPFEKAAGMAANQWGIRKRIFVFTPNGSESDQTKEIIINPSYVPYIPENKTESKMIEDYEGCFSVPLSLGIVARYEKIIATYYDSEGIKIECILGGWKARVFQHETDHLNGKLFDSTFDNYSGPKCIKKLTFNNNEELKLFYQNRNK